MADGANRSFRAGKRHNFATTLKKQVFHGSMKRKDLKFMRHRLTTGNQKEALLETSMRRVSPWFAKIYPPWMKKYWKTAKTDWSIRARPKTSACCSVSTKCWTAPATACSSKRQARSAKPRKRPWPILESNPESQALWKSSREAREVARCRRNWERRRV